MTPKGTRPGAGNQRLASHGHEHEHGSTRGDVSASSRYTPPTSRDMIESPRWVPILMIVLLVIGALVILLRYIVWTDSNWPILIGLGFLLGGLYTATKWE